MTFFFLFLLLQELRKQLKKTDSPEVIKEIKDRLSWIVSACPTDSSHLPNFDIYFSNFCLSL